jgi:polysaccharide transporter, PST family
VFTFMGVTKSIWIIAENQGAYSLVFTCLGVITNVVLNFWLIPRYQAIGAAIATLISYGFVDYLSCFLYPRARRVGWIMTRSLTFTSPVSRLLCRL